MRRAAVVAAGMTAAALALAAWLGGEEPPAPSAPRAAIAAAAPAELASTPEPTGAKEAPPAARPAWPPLRSQAAVATPSERPRRLADLPPRPSDRLAPREATLARMAQTVESNPRLAPFLRAAREIGLEQDKQEKLLGLLRSKCDAPSVEPSAATPAQPDLRQAMRLRAQTLKTLWAPLFDIAGSDTGRLVAIAMRPGTADVGR